MKEYTLKRIWDGIPDRLEQVYDEGLDHWYVWVTEDRAEAEDIARRYNGTNVSSRKVVMERDVTEWVEREET